MRHNLPVSEREHPIGDDSVILSTTDPRGKITYINDDFLEACGYAQEELIGSPHNIVRHPSMPPAAFGSLWETIKSGRAWMGIVKNRRKNGDHYWVDAFATPIMQGSEVMEFQSVRLKARSEDVERARKVYEELNSGATPQPLKRRPLCVRVRIGLWFSAVMAGLLGGAELMGWLQPVPALMIWLGAMLFHWLLLVWILAPLMKVLETARGISDDRLACYVYTGRTDEAGQLQLAFKTLKSDASAVVSRLLDYTGYLRRSMQTLSDNLGESFAGIQRMFDEISQVETSVHQSAEAAREVSRSAQSGSEAMAAALGSAESGMDSVSATLASMSSLAARINRAVEAINRLDADSGSVNAVLDVIRSVAEQTNLLALNAAIEAARAGEHGRGFAVMADEVRTLANRTQDSTREIQDMLLRLHDGARCAVEAIGQAREEVQQGVDQARRSAEAIDSVRGSVRSISDMSQQIAAAVEEQTCASVEMGQAISRVRQYASGVLGTVESNRDLSREVSDHAGRLSQLAQEFWNKRARH